jgi:hypothetical protein
MAERQDFIVEVHVVVRAASADAAEGRVTNHLRNFARDTHAENVYIADVRGEDDDDAAE